MSMHTPGPWRDYGFHLDGIDGERVVAQDGDNMGYAVACCLPCGEPDSTPERTAANARLIASAPDHALICQAIVSGAGRWEPWADDHGEFCIGGMRYATHLDEFGCPVVNGAIRAAIASVGSQS